MQKLSKPKVLITVTRKSSAQYSGLHRLSALTGHDVSEELIVSIFRVEEDAKQECTSDKPNSAYCWLCLSSGSEMPSKVLFLKVGNSPDYTTVQPTAQ
jgi:hypothetical protein